MLAGSHQACTSGCRVYRTKHGGRTGLKTSCDSCSGNPRQKQVGLECSSGLLLNMETSTIEKGVMQVHTLISFPQEDIDTLTKP